MRTIEGQYRTSRVASSEQEDDDTDWVAMGSVPEGEDFVTPELELGTAYDFRVRTLESDGTASAWTYVNEETAAAELSVPDAPTGLRVAGGCLSWDHDPQPVDLAGYLVRHAPGHDTLWDAAEPAHEGLWPAPPFPRCMIPKGIRTLLVAAVDHDGNVGPAVPFQADLGPLDEGTPYEIARYDQVVLGWPGIYAAGALDGVVFKGTSFATSPAWSTDCEPAWAAGAGTEPAWTHDSDPAWGLYGGDNLPAWLADDAGPAWPQMYGWIDYRFTATIRTCGNGCPDTLSLDATFLAGSWWRVEYRTEDTPAWTGDDVKAWTGDADAAWDPGPFAWRPWPGYVERAPFGAHQFRVIAPGGLVQPQLSALIARVSTGLREQVLLNVPVGVGSSRLPLAPPDFVAIVDVDLTLFGLIGTTSHTAKLLDMDPKGPHVVVMDQAGAPVAGRVNATIRGY